MLLDPHMAAGHLLGIDSRLSNGVGWRRADAPIRRADPKKVGGPPIMFADRIITNW